jgi:hypothetical protein
MGLGRIAEKLSDDDWVKFNNYQRVHMNYLEWLVLHIAGYEEEFYLRELNAI